MFFFCFFLLFSVVFLFYCFTHDTSPEDQKMGKGIVYAASVCYPQTDLYVPLSITVTADGKMSIKKVDMLEDDYTEETPE